MPSTMRSQDTRAALTSQEAVRGATVREAYWRERLGALKTLLKG
jgi:hypothetical protein